MLPATASLLFSAERKKAAGSGFGKAADSKDCQMKRARNRHDAGASNEGFGS
jgi:hypothetical protein